MTLEKQKTLTDEEICSKLVDYYFEEILNLDTLMTSLEDYETYYPRVRRIFLKRCWMLLLEQDRLGSDKWLSGGN